ncbi:hypothetical protein PR048_006909 [Dryococelus australis]|uniref:Transposable element P transposase-like RNase H domain-containing protein n=1 Tax=Dryococelus australis TaxID=614101 RepID=A0ABQ9IDH7_9NEOP|nr:hypothetical protein PR048_006909 [Dryococelus australis]
MSGCAVKNCRNYSRKLAQRKDVFKADTSRVCSIHFSENDYERDLKSELTGIKRKRTLKTDLVPHLFLPNVTSNDFPERSERLKNRTVKKKLVPDLTEMRKRKRHSENPKCEENKNNGTRVVTQEMNEQTMCQPGSNVFTPKQIERLVFRNKKRIWWEDDDIAAAVTLRSISRKAYLYLRKNVGLPLSGLSTIRKWTRNLKCLPGIQKESLSVLKGRSLWMSSRERLTIISFDEIRVDSRMCHDQRENRIMGPHSNAQVIIARGLASKWKQPIFYDFDRNITKDKLFEVIKEVEESGFKVVAIASDMGGGNLSLWRNLQISTNKVSFTDLVDVTREEWVFADIPHLIKLLRNNFLDYGIRLSCGTEISKWQLQQILHDKELSLTPKLDSRVHLNVSGSARQKVNIGNSDNPTPTQFKYRIRMLLFGNALYLPSGTCVQDMSTKKPHLTSQLLIKYMENITTEENAISDNVNCENSEVTEDIEDEPDEE